MPPNPSPVILDWIESSFNKLETNPEFLPAYQRFMFREIEEFPTPEGLDFHEYIDSITELDEPDSATYAEIFESEGKQFISCLKPVLEEGHMEHFAEIYAKKRISDCYEERVSEEAYKAIGAQNQPWSTDNPGYQEVLYACHKRGDDDEFAHRCAKELIDREWSCTNAYAATSSYYKHMHESLAKGRSQFFAETYAWAWEHYEVRDIALHYAECFENLIVSGRGPDEAKQIAHIYAIKFSDYCHPDNDPDDDQDELDYELMKDYSLAKAESAFRFTKLPPEHMRLPDIFIQIYQRRAPGDGSKHWFNEIEQLARSVVAGQLDMNEIQLSSTMEFLEEESRREESEKPPRFDLMSEAELKRFNSKSDEELVAKEEEVEFREDCREAGFDPTDPEEREAYKEILDETRDDDY